jgi:hypothetical protein
MVVTSRTTTLLLCIGLACCGGSASESPWPEEPVENDPTPAGEDPGHGKTIDTKKLPDRYTKKPKKTPEAEEEEAPEEAPSEEEEAEPEE